MDFFDTINKRYSVRGFQDKEVEKEKLDKVLEAGRIAPTGVNYQPFKIFVIDTKKNQEALKNIYAAEWFRQAPYVICVAVSKVKAWVRPFDGKNIAEIDGTIVMDHMILAATALGLGTCFVAAFKAQYAREFLNLGEEYEPILFTPLGYPDAEPRGTDRKPLDELVEFI